MKFWHGLLLFDDTLQWRHNERNGVSNHQPHDCLLKRYQAQIKKNIKAPRHWICAGNSPVTGEFPAQRVSNVENVSIWWRHHKWNAHQRYHLWMMCSCLKSGLGCYPPLIRLIFLNHASFRFPSHDKCFRNPWLAFPVLGNLNTVTSHERYGVSNNRQHAYLSAACPS